jgi:hypothetical protein
MSLRASSVFICPENFTFYIFQLCCFVVLQLSVVFVSPFIARVISLECARVVALFCTVFVLSPDEISLKPQSLFNNVGQTAQQNMSKFLQLGVN